METAAIAANEVLACIADVATSDLLNFIEVDNNGGWKVDLKLVKRLGLRKSGVGGNPGRKSGAEIRCRKSGVSSSFLPENPVSVRHSCPKSGVSSSFLPEIRAG